MADLVLSDGKEITFDLSKVKHKEFVKFWNGKPKDQTPEEEKEREQFESDFLFKVCGLTAEQIDELAQTDWRVFYDKFPQVCFAPLEEHQKNSVSASTTPERASKRKPRPNSNAG